MAQMEKRYTRRLNQSGNSLSAGIPKAIADKLQLAKGDEINVHYNEETGEIIMKKANHSLPEGVRPDVLQAMNRAVDKYDEALRNLKDR
ncbi:AbrB/MazE/SpoVT family DNA-binding domain-containing protein [Marinococcus sp. PL1-022]|uniref:AbrB/MazE/SpoVT family DNA-binding domain-containing protein n=1 Tax=Marinococcus sp. PL1-022 TaxID=3095363 RepID=UPI0029C37C43|nr:AbrB/MazE/SpoVT family DNA-binding domain-containing protein [Marinococcus sp. PL1-022]MDX6152667.1 AbrB/MazE/SpoVT family DNA-binding domain-containing protein [Marinococcus sp. PL1-022]